MAGQDIPVTKKRGRPSGPPTAVVRLPAEVIDAAGEWASRQPDNPPRPEAITRLVRKGLDQV